MDLKKPSSTLLLMDSCPFKHKASNIILSQLLNFLPDDLCGYFLNSNKVPAVLFSDPKLQGLPKRITLKPSLKDFASFIKEHQVAKIFCILNSIPALDFIFDISKKINLPLYILIIEPPTWLRHNRRIKRIFCNRTPKFNEVLTKARAVATTSFNLAEDFQKELKISAIPISLGLDLNLFLNLVPKVFEQKQSQTQDQPQTQLENTEKETFIISVLDNLFLTHAWNILLQTLNFVNWTIAGKKIKIRYLSRKLYLDAANANIEYLGERPLEETMQFLMQSDMLYYSTTFEKDKANEVRHSSLPIELYYYLATQKPIVLHAPRYSEISQFLEKNNAGLLVDDLQKANLYQTIERIMWDKDIVEIAPINGRKALVSDLSVSHMQTQFQRFLAA